MDLQSKMNIVKQRNGIAVFGCSEDDLKLFSDEDLMELKQSGLITDEAYHKEILFREECWDLSFITSDDYCDEACPECGCELKASLDGKSDCPYCGHKQVKPCAVCCDIHYDSECKKNDCNFSFKNGCTPFPHLEEV